MTEDWRHHATAMTTRLADAGELTDPHWRETFAAVPRQVFVPGHDLHEAYGVDAIVTQTKPAPVAGGGTVELPTSSVSAPGAVAVMLDRLAITDGDCVLEIGTGTGYNAALLCHRLGGQDVTSVDLDPELTDTVRSRLDELGYRPTLVTGDGHTGVPSRAPYDAVLATGAVTHIPPAWIRQLAPGGRIVAPLIGAHDAALMVLVKTADDEVTGRFGTYRVSFMPLRPDLANPLADGGTLGMSATGMTHDGTTHTDPAQLVDPDDDLALFVHLHVPGLVIGAAEHHILGKTVIVADATAYAEAALTTDRQSTWTVRQRGPHRLWDTVEHALHRWHTLGQPDRTRYGITALDDVGRQYVWLDDADGAYSWPMPL